MVEANFVEEPLGLNDAYAVNLKRLVARELDLDAERQGQTTRVIEDTITFRKALDAQYIADIARMREVGNQSMESFTKQMNQMSVDNRVTGIRKELKAEERQEELEEVFNKSVQTGSNQQTGASNEVVSGIIQLLAESGLLSSVVAGSQQTAGKTRSKNYD